MKRINRRDMLSSGTTGAAVAFAGVGEFLADSARENAAHDAQLSGLRAHCESAATLHQLGLRPIVNAAGTITTLGGPLMAPEVQAAWNAGARHFVDLGSLSDLYDGPCAG